MNLRKLLALTLIGGLCLLCAYATHSLGRNRLEQAVRPPSQSSLLEVEKLSALPLRRRNDNYQVQFVYASFGWLYTGKRIWRTQDGGKAWTLIFQVDDDPEALKKAEVNEIAKLQFINERSGWMSVFRRYLANHEEIYSKRYKNVGSWLTPSIAKVFHRRNIADAPEIKAVLPVNADVMS
jgi:hypothetical protein